MGPPKPQPHPQPQPNTDELMDKIRTLETGHANLRDDMSKLMLSSGLNRNRRSNSVSPQRRGGDDGRAVWNKRSMSFKDLPSSSSPLRRESHSAAESTTPAPEMQAEPAAGHLFTNKQYLNILQCMGQSVHILGPNARIVYWNRSAENLYGYSSVEAIGRDICELLVSSRDVPVAEVIMSHCKMGQRWTGQFPITHKMGQKFPVIVTNTPFYDDDGTILGIVCVSADMKPFKDVQVPSSDADEVQVDQDLSGPRSSVMTGLGLDPDQSLQNAISSKITNLVGFPI